MANNRKRKEKMMLTPDSHYKSSLRSKLAITKMFGVIKKK